MERGSLVVISGPSGVGKGTICRKLMERYPELRLSISATTRAPREGEQEGVSYFFKSKEEFRALIDEGMMLEHAEIYGNYYGTPRKPVLDSLEAGHSVILEIEMDGAAQVKQSYPEAVLIFIIPPSLQIQYERIKKRGTETEEKIRERISCAAEEMKRVSEYDFFVINDDLDTAVDNVKEIIDIMSKVEKYKVGSRSKQIVSEILEGKNVTAVN